MRMRGEGSLAPRARARAGAARCTVGYCGPGRLVRRRARGRDRDRERDRDRDRDQTKRGEREPGKKRKNRAGQQRNRSAPAPLLTPLSPAPAVCLLQHRRSGRAAAMASSSGTDVIQVTNVSPSASSEQMRTLFGFLGKIEELRLFPPE